MIEGKDLQAEVALLRNENAALQQLLDIYEITVEQQSKRLEDALALLTHEQHSLYAQMRLEAEYDALTGLPNRSNFANQLENLLQSAGADPDYRFAVLSLDIDRFQAINDSMGHLAGDQLLHAIAQRLVTSVRTTEMVSLISGEPTVARFSGDQFAVLLEDIKEIANVPQICDRIQQTLAAPFFIDGRELFATASIGVALSAVAYLSAEDILRDADIAMRRSKAMGKGRWQVFHSEMRASALVRWELENDLRHALERNELRVYYQPKVVVSTGEVAGFEALLRWEHPKRGLISPLQFIPIAEETGLILPIGNWVLREACRQLREWNDEFQSEPPLNVSVNLSCRQVSGPALVDQVADALRDTGVDPELLWLEVTESNLMSNTEFAIAVLNKLKAMGVGLMIDDFGTGYSSLNHLAQFPFDTLKIDQSFVGELDKELDGVEIVKTMLALAGNLGMDVVAEGIETEGQLEQLQALGCIYGQGYLFARPLTAQATKQMLAKIAGNKNLPIAILAA